MPWNEKVNFSTTERRYFIHVSKLLWFFTITVDKENISILTSRRRVWTGQFLAVSKQILGPNVSRKREISIFGVLKTIMSWWRHNLQYLRVDRLRG